MGPCIMLKVLPFSSLHENLHRVNYASYVTNVENAQNLYLQYLKLRYQFRLTLVEAIQEIIVIAQ